MNILWRVIPAVFSIACFSSFVWAVKNHFWKPNDENVSVGMTAISFFSLFFVLLQLVGFFLAPHMSILTSIGGSLIFMASFTLFWWSIYVTNKNRLTLAFSSDEPQCILTTGPYRNLRHPFYTSYLLFWIAGAVAGCQWWFFPSVVIMTVFYYRAARFEEAKFKNSHLREKYEDYRRRAGMFAPRIFDS